MRTLRKILALLLLASACAALFAGKGVLYALGMVFLSLGVWPGEVESTSGTRDNRELEAGGPSLGPLAKARADYAEIQNSMGLIQDKEMTGQLKKLQSIAKKMLHYLGNHPQRASTASQFIDYYQDKTASLVRQYIILQETGMQTPALTALEQDMKTTFQGFIVAYQKQFNRVLEHDVLNMNSEMKVARQVMQEEGIDWEEMEKAQQAIRIEQSEVPENAEKKGGGWNLKHAGMALGAVVLGAVGLYKVFGGDEKK